MIHMQRLTSCAHTQMQSLTGQKSWVSYQCGDLVSLPHTAITFWGGPIVNSSYAVFICESVLLLCVFTAENTKKKFTHPNDATNTGKPVPASSFPKINFCPFRCKYWKELEIFEYLHPDFPKVQWSKIAFTCVCKAKRHGKGCICGQLLIVAA